MLNLSFLKKEVLKLPFFYSLFFVLLLIQKIYADDSNPSINVYGTPGLIDIPVAWENTDGQISFSSSISNTHLRNSFSFQALPRISGTFRYTGVGDRNIKFKNTSGYSTWDRSFDVRINVLNETNFQPELTFGFQDIIGTGNFSSEYIVASKSFTPKLKSSMGLGWGRLGSNKSIRGFGNRKYNGGSNGGIPSIDQIYRGPIGVFGGFEYDVLVDKLKLKLEYSSDDYSADENYLEKLPDMPINLGVSYSLFDSFKLDGFVSGNKLGVQLNISINPNDYNGGDYLENSPQPFYSFPLPQKNINLQSVWGEINSILKSENINLIGYKVDKNEVSLVIENNHYSSNSQSAGRTLRIMSRYIPKRYKVFSVFFSSGGIPVSKVSFDRNYLETIIDAPNAEILSKKINKFTFAPKNLENYSVIENQYNKFSLSFSSYYRLHLFDPNKPLYYDIGPEMFFGYKFKPGLELNGVVDASVLSTFDEISRGPKGNLPFVRTDLKDYLNVMDPRIRDLSLSSLYKFSPKVYGRMTAGILEPMFSGISNEILYFNAFPNISLGAEINYVHKRDYRQLFGLRKLNGMANLNGHLSAYWDTGFKNYIGQLDVGKYLAGDNGGSVTVTRDFPNGWKIGGFFSLTDASFADFGEGSFDKGFFIRVPYGSIMPYESKDGLLESIRPIQGDGGQRVGVNGRLYDILSEYSESNINSGWMRIWR